jgi:hypothetical protein
LIAAVARRISSVGLTLGRKPVESSGDRVIAKAAQQMIAVEIVSDLKL